MDRQNFNSASSDKYTLHISNAATENQLSDEHQSSANEFTALIQPPLDLNNLMYLRARETDLKLENLNIDSLPLIFQKNDTEIIKTKLVIDSNICRDNFILDKDQLHEENQNLLEIAVGDFHSLQPSKCLQYLNSLIENSSNLFIIKRYLEVLVDDDSIFQNQIFDGLSAEKSVDDDVTTHDLNLIYRYCEMAIYSRIEVSKHLNDLVNPKRKLKDLLDTKVPYRYDSKLDRTEEERALHASRVLNSPDKRRHFNHSLGVASTSTIKLIDLTNYYDINFKRFSENQKTRKSEEIKSALLKWLSMANKLKKKTNGQLTDENKTYLEEWQYNNLIIIGMGRKLLKLIFNAKERLMRPNSKIFNRQFLTLSLDRSQLKCHFHINKNKLADKCSLTIQFPYYVSYKIGCSITTSPESEKKMNKVTVGPISLDDEQSNLPMYTNSILSERQRLFSSFRFSPQLLCVKSPILAETARESERAILFSPDNDYITFFQMPLKIHKYGTNIISTTASHGKIHQDFFKVHRNHNILSQIKIRITDENNIDFRSVRHATL